MSQEHLEDKDLLLDIQKGAHDAFSKLVEKHSAKFYNLAFRITNNKEHSEDLVQECFLKLWIKPQSFNINKEVKFTTWFYRVISNAALDLKRKNSKLIAIDDNSKWIYEGQKVEDILDEEKFQTILWSFINQLPEKQQLALNLCFYEELKNKEAASIMDISLKALESLLMRAKKKLKADFEKLEQNKEYQNA